MNRNDVQKGSPIDTQIRVEEPNTMVDKNGNLQERHLYTVWICLTTGEIAFQGPNYQNVIDNIFPVLKRIVTDKVGLISNYVHHELQSKKTPKQTKVRFKLDLGQKGVQTSLVV